MVEPSKSAFIVSLPSIEFDTALSGTSKFQLMLLTFPVSKIRNAKLLNAINPKLSRLLTFVGANENGLRVVHRISFRFDHNFFDHHISGSEPKVRLGTCEAKRLTVG